MGNSNSPETMTRNRELDKILEFSTDIICTIDEHGTLLRISASVYQILGYTAAELVGTSYKKIIDPRDFETSALIGAKIKDGFVLSGFENHYIHKSGKIIPMIWSASWDNEEKIMHCIARDGTEKQQAELWRKSLEESNTRYDLVTKATSDAIWDWDIIMGTLYWGEGFETIFGHKSSETLPDISSWIQHIHNEDSERVLNGINKVIHGTGTNWKDEYRYQRVDQTYAYVVDRGFVIRNQQGDAIRMVGAMHDISERKKAQVELKQFADDLFLRNRDLQQFGYVVSHNLRSPVANIIGITDLLEQEKNDPASVGECIENLKTSIFRLDDVIKDLSEILSVTDGSVDIKTELLDLVEIITNIKIDLKEMIAEANAVIDVDQFVLTIRSHKAYLYSIFFNLISNALKYKVDKTPVINISLQAMSSGTEIRVSDNGPGIDLSKYEEDMFKPYTKFDCSKDGKGLGLFLVKSHVQALGGRISVESQLGKGTTFIIAL